MESFPQLVFLHGDVNNYSDKNVTEEVKRMDEELVEKLIPILKDHPLVVIGYRGAEPSITQHLLINSAERAENYKYGIYWCLRKGETPEHSPEYVQKLNDTIKSNLTFVEIESFDRLFNKVVWSRLEEQKSEFDRERTYYTTSDLEAGITNFDLKKAKEYDTEDFNESLEHVWE